ncbi:molybdopterin synthase sulfur carrier subunit [Osmerus eperlanus]|uniref:molybdopterin synthase sulfur carrier subunit n=1 Tax=Osmerus eperlanus TaxID=29151 RepID=UPI002E133B2D
MTTKVSVLVLYFAKSADLTGLKSEVIHVQPELTTLALWQELVNRHSRLSAVREQIVLAVSQEYVTIGCQLVSLKNGDEVAVIPPLSGG